jgi:hypothetical protein
MTNETHGDEVGERVSVVRVKMMNLKIVDLVFVAL